LTPVSKKGVPHGDTYVVCLDCGKQFEYDLNAMRIGKVIGISHDGSIVPQAVTTPSKSKAKYAVAVAAPVAAVVIGAMLKRKKAEPQKSEHTPDVPGSVHSVASAEDDKPTPPIGK
jgi:hypothetical protein